MLSRIAACSLVVLVLAPFTAPFPTCDVATLFGSHSRQMPAHGPASTRLGSDATDVSVPAMSRSPRMRLLALSGVFASPMACVPASATAARTDAPAARLRGRVALATNLRV